MRAIWNSLYYTSKFCVMKMKWKNEKKFLKEKHDKLDDESENHSIACMLDQMQQIHFRTKKWLQKHCLFSW